MIPATATAAVSWIGPRATSAPGIQPVPPPSPPASGTTASLPPHAASSRRRLRKQLDLRRQRAHVTEQIGDERIRPRQARLVGELAVLLDVRADPLAGRGIRVTAAGDRTELRLVALPDGVEAVVARDLRDHARSSDGGVMFLGAIDGQELPALEAQ